MKNPHKNRYLSVGKRLWDRVQRGSLNECWPWTGPRSSFGYGKLRHLGKLDGAHRVAFMLSVGPVHDGMFVCHRCDNPPCCNPAHLFLGTARDNNADMDHKARRRNGFASVITAQEAVEIWNTQGTASDVGVKFGISASAVKSIWQGRSWAKVTGGAAAHHVRAKAAQANATAEADVSRIADLAKLGLSMGEIARRTGISRPTVTKYARPLDGHIAATRAAITPALSADHRRA